MCWGASSVLGLCGGLSAFILLIGLVMWYIASSSYEKHQWFPLVKTWHLYAKVVGLLLKVLGSGLEFGAENNNGGEYSARWLVSTIFEFCGNCIILLVLIQNARCLFRAIHLPSHIKLLTEPERVAYKLGEQLRAVRWATLLLLAFLVLGSGAVLEFTVARQQRADVEDDDRIVWKWSAAEEIVLAGGLGIYCAIWVVYEWYILVHTVSGGRGRDCTSVLSIIVVIAALALELFGASTECWWAICQGQNWWIASSLCDGAGFAIWATGTLFEMDARKLLKCRWGDSHAPNQTQYRQQHDI